MYIGPTTELGLQLGLRLWLASFLRLSSGNH